ncbi:hypothetical protein CHU95_17405 [Niveispirillum lacus]|uniref:Uncharacterized protein n=1 Tax=Niveispirillum lacus TaxID=1981099 RepID=A0A255YTP4_9PROT|nr:hypothetical protein [Niveispirillum lacus]OYQ32559.1 hypothetical protein CHU95_17405 [Niveispirillum lacus]
MTHHPKEWLDDWLQTDMSGDQEGIADFIAGLTGGPCPERRVGNLYAASIAAEGLLLENIMQDDWPPVLVPASMALTGLMRVR